MNEKDLLDFLIRNDIKYEDGYSYNQLIIYLNFLRNQYRILYEKNLIKEEKIEGLLIALDSERKEINKKDIIIKLKNEEINNLKKRMLQKMSLKERIFGKIKL